MAKDRPFYLFLSGVILGWGLLLTWNLNHHYCWITNPDISDRLYGCGTALIFLGCAHLINSGKRFGWKKAITEFFFYTTISNFCDELFFDPFVNSPWEWILAALVWFYLLYHNNRYDDTR